MWNGMEFDPHPNNQRKTSSWKPAKRWTNKEVGIHKLVSVFVGNQVD